SAARQHAQYSSFVVYRDKIGYHNRTQPIHEPIGPKSCATHGNIADWLASTACNGEAVLPLIAERESPRQFLPIAPHVGICGRNPGCLDAIQSCSNGCLHIAAGDRVILELEVGVTPGRSQ